MRTVSLTWKPFAARIIVLSLAFCALAGWCVGSSLAAPEGAPRPRARKRVQGRPVPRGPAVERPEPSGSAATRPESGGSAAVRPKEVPEADKGTASLIFFYYGDSKYNTLGQETLKLKKAMEGYKYCVLLKHESLPSWADLSEKDEKLANVKDTPTRANLFEQILDLTEKGYSIDLYVFSHGWSEKFKASKGSSGSEDYVTSSDILSELSPEKTGFTTIPIRIVWGTNCYGSTLGDAWRSVGAKATAGARYVQFYPNAFGNFIGDWNKGSVSFEDAVRDSDTAAVRTVVQTYLSLVDAPSRKKKGEWGGCSFGKTVLGDDACAKDYFTSVWIAKDEWQSGKSGKDNMNHSSFMVLGGEKSLTKNSKPVWK